MPNDERILETMPDGALGLIPLKSCEELGAKVDQYLVGWREKREHAHKNEAAFKGYHRDSYIISTSVPRFGTGEAKGVIKESVRGYDLYLMVDVTNYSLTYSVSGHENHMSPDDHYADLKRIIAAVGGKARRITAIIPFLYESRQHKRTARESLDCALALQELTAMGVDNIITFDAHDPRVQNAIPLKGFETVQPAYQFIKGILKNCDDLKLDNDHLMIISPDEGGTNRAVYLANVLGVDMGMFYKRRDYSKIVDGRNPIVAETKETVKDTAKKATEKVEAATKTAVKKAAAKKAAPKKEELKPEVFIQFQGQEAVVADVIEKAKKQFEAEGHRASSIKSIQVYLKPEEYAAYYVINQKHAGRVDLF